MPSASALTSFLLLPAAILASYDCSHVRVDQQSWNLEKLGGPKDVHFLQHKYPTIRNTTYTIDICKALTYPSGTKKLDKCPGGTRVCGIERSYDSDHEEGVLVQVIPIAGEYHLSEGRKLDPKFTRIKDGKSNSESEKEGVIIEYHGGLHDTVKQKAIVEFQCDRDMEGTEGFEDKTKSFDATSFDDYGRMGKREAADDDDEGDGDEDEGPLPDLDEGKALQYVSYKSEKSDKDDVMVLRLNWKTKYACEGEAAKVPGKTTAGWGFFTWFLIIVFLLIAAYIIFGSWLNYNRYGARGWDLLPHGDAIRDLPYLVKDWSGNVVDKLKGSGSNRGGYSAV